MGETIMKPEYDQWAEYLLQEIYYAPTPEHRVAVIKEHLLKAVQRGYTDGLDNGWAIEQDKDYKCCEACDTYCDIQADLALQEYCDKCDRSYTPDSKGWQTI